MLSSLLRGRPCKINSPVTERTDLTRLQVLALPLADIPKYLSHLSRPTPINITKLACYLQGHPDQPSVYNILSSQGFKIDNSGPRAPEEYSNLP